METILKKAKSIQKANLPWSVIRGAALASVLTVEAVFASADCVTCNQIVYDASSGLPAAPCFIQGGSGGASINDGKLLLFASSGEIYFTANSQILPFRWSDGLTLEGKLRVPVGTGSGSPGPGFRGSAIMIALDSDYQTYGVYIWSSGIAFTSNFNFNQNDPSTFQTMAFDAASAPHTYTIKSDSLGASLFIDGVSRIYLAKGAPNQQNSPSYNFGIDSRHGPSLTEWEYVRFSLRAACAADFDCDSQVGDSDFNVFAAAYEILECSNPAMPAGCPADLNGDTVVDDVDFALFVIAYDAFACP